MTAALAVEVIGSATSIDDLPNLTTDIFPVARVKGVMINSQIELIQLEDARILFTRNLLTEDEEDPYLTLLSGSIFQRLRVEKFVDDSAVNLSAAVNGTAALSSTQSSITFTGTAGTDMELTTNDLLDGASIPSLQAFFVQTEGSADISFQFSTTSSTSGFSTQTYQIGEVIQVVSTVASRLYLKLIISGSDFIGSATTALNSLGVLFNVDEGAPSTLNITEFGLDNAIESTNNLIANGNFYYWSKRTSEGSAPDLTSQSTLTFPLSSTDTTGPDGWVFTTLNSPADSNTCSRVVVGTIDNSSLYGLQTFFSGTERNALEYRVPFMANMSGKHLTYSLDYSTAAAASFRIGIGQWTRTAAGLQLVHTSEALAIQTSGTVTVTTSQSLGTDIDQVSFYVIYEGVGTTTAVTLYNARAAVGSFSVLPFTYVADPASTLSGYYETGRAVVAGYALESVPIGLSAQFSTVKQTSLGTLVSQGIADVSGNKSSNISAVSFASTAKTTVISASTGSTGPYAMDVEWEAYINYEGSVI